MHAHARSSAHSERSRDITQVVSKDFLHAFGIAAVVRVAKHADFSWADSAAHRERCCVAEQLGLVLELDMSDVPFCTATIVDRFLASRAAMVARNNHKREPEIGAAEAERLQA